MKQFLFAVVLIATFAAYALFVQPSTQLGTNTLPVNIPVVPTTPAKEVVVPVTPTPTPVVTPPVTPTPVIPTVPVAPTPVIPKGQYRDGTYQGVSADAYYGYIQVEAVIQGGKISDVIFLDHPQDRRESMVINNYAMPRLTSEAISAQTANVNVVSGATDTSNAFVQSLASALVKAKN
jgi:uncharacterized protein with FMN-binding domain